MDACTSITKREMISREILGCTFNPLPADTKLVTPRLDFTKILVEAFVHTDCKSAKKADSLTVFLVLLGSADVKDSRKMLGKLTINRLFK